MLGEVILSRRRLLSPRDSWVYEIDLDGRFLMSSTVRFSEEGSVRNVVPWSHADDFFETIREFAALDGAFIVNETGVVEAAGVYLEVPRKRIRLPQGLGARHSAAAGITAATTAVAVVVSESSGTVTTFRGGRPVLTLEKPAISLGAAVG